MKIPSVYFVVLCVGYEHRRIKCSKQYTLPLPTAIIHPIFSTENNDNNHYIPAFRLFILDINQKKVVFCVLLLELYNHSHPNPSYFHPPPPTPSNKPAGKTKNCMYGIWNEIEGVLKRKKCKQNQCMCVLNVVHAIPEIIPTRDFDYVLMRLKKHFFFIWALEWNLEAYFFFLVLYIVFIVCVVLFPFDISLLFFFLISATIFVSAVVFYLIDCLCEYGVGVENASAKKNWNLESS